MKIKNKFVWILVLVGAPAMAASVYIPIPATGITANACSSGLFANAIDATGLLTCASPSGTVTSVGLTPPVGYSVSGSPVTTSGTLVLSLKAAQAIGASAVDWSAGSVFSKSIGATNTTFTFSNSADGQTITVAVTSTTGTVTWPAVSWQGGAAPPQTDNKTDLYTFIKVGSTIYGSAVQGF